MADQRRPPRVGVEQRHAGEHERDHAEGETQVRDPPGQRPAVVIRGLFGRRQFGDFDVRPVLVLLVISELAVIPERRMRPEERKHAAEQQQHEFRGQPRVGIALEIVVVGVRLERQEALGRVDMAVLAGLQPVGRKDARRRVRYALDVVAAVAIEALGGEGEAQLVDLAVIGVEVGGEFLLVAIAAVLGDGELGRGQERILDVHSVMAIRAHRRLRIAVLQHLLAVHRIAIDLELLGVALAAGVRQIEPPPVIIGGALRIDVMRVVAIVAGGVGARLVLQAGLRMDRPQEEVDLRDHFAQFLEFLAVGFAFVLGVFIQRLMAFDAADLDGGLGVRNLRDVLVAVDAF